MPDTRQPAVPASPGADRLRGRLMAASLGKLLDRVRGSRDVLPHLAALERSLQMQGLAALAEVSPHHLTRICSQMESLPLPKDDAPLQELLGRLMDALERNQPAASNVPFDMEKTMVIEEISHSDFMAAARGDLPTEIDDSRSLDGRPAKR